MATLQWSGTTRTVTMVDIGRPDVLDDDFTEVVTGIASDAVWSSGAGKGRITGTGSNDLVFLDDADFASPRLDNIATFSMGGGTDVVDLTSSRLAYGRVKVDGGAGDDWLYSNGGRDKLLGGTGEDRLKGGAGNDKIEGGADGDYMAGGAGRDIFVFRDDEGQDNIFDFQTAGKGHDLIDLSGSARITDFADLMANHVMVENGELKIRMGDSSYIRIYDVQPNDLQPDDFIF